MADGWRRFTGRSPYPELSANSTRSAFTYATKPDRDFRIKWLEGVRDGRLEREVLDWVARLVGEGGQRSWHNDSQIVDWLGDGNVICRLLQRLFPQIMPHDASIRSGSSTFASFHNLSTAIAALRNLGLSPNDLFDVAQLVNRRDPSGILRTLAALRNHHQHHHNSTFQR